MGQCASAVIQRPLSSIDHPIMTSILKNNDDLENVMMNMSKIDHVCGLLRVIERLDILVRECNVKWACVCVHTEWGVVILAQSGNASTIDLTTCIKDNVHHYKGSMLYRVKNACKCHDHQTFGELIVALPTKMNVLHTNSKFYINCLSTLCTPNVCIETIIDLCKGLAIANTIQLQADFMYSTMDSIQRYMSSVVNLNMGIRIAWLDDFGSSIALFEDGEVIEMPLKNTLLSDAINVGKARFISDCAAYISSSSEPATDIFVSPWRTVASIVVCPIGTGKNDKYKPIGGVYFTLDYPTSFVHMKQYIQGLMCIVTEHLRVRCLERHVELWNWVKLNTGSASYSSNEIHRSSQSGSQSGSGSGSSSKTITLRDQDERKQRLSWLFQRPAKKSWDQVDTKRSSSDSEPRKPRMLNRSTKAIYNLLSKEFVSYMNTEELHDDWVSEITSLELIGKGGFGDVYRCRWRGNLIAVKIMHPKRTDKNLVKDAVEMSVMTIINHPNIVQVYMCKHDVPYEDSSRNSANNRVSFSLENIAKHTSTCNIMVMEYCDRGNLRQAIRKGVFHRLLIDQSIGIDMFLITQVLSEIASSVRYLHAIRIVHGDIKPENILLKSDASRNIGFLVKLTDFGLARMLRTEHGSVNHEGMGCGTVTHIAPELLVRGGMVTFSVDVHAFGIMMWEIYTGQRVYRGMNKQDIAAYVCNLHGRPVFPTGTPPEYQELAEKCWNQVPSSRPTFEYIVDKLTEMNNMYQTTSDVFVS
jgi:hypothetical protein